MKQPNSQGYSVRVTSETIILIVKRSYELTVADIIFQVTGALVSAKRNSKMIRPLPVKEIGHYEK